MLSTPVANGLAQEMRTKKTKRWSSLEQFVRNCRGIWEKVGCRYAKKYKEAADPRLADCDGQNPMHWAYVEEEERREREEAGERVCVWKGL